MTDGLAWIILLGALILLIAIGVLSFIYRDQLLYNSDTDKLKIERCLSRHGAARLGYNDHYLGCDIWPRS